jgi:two-component system sensor kinase FixL
MGQIFPTMWQLANANRVGFPRGWALLSLFLAALAVGTGELQSRPSAEQAMLSASALPAENESRPEEKNFWQRYTWEIVVTVSAMLVQTAIISLLLVNLARRRRAELSLIESKERLQTILNTTDEGIIAVNEKGIIETANAASKRIFGCTDAEIIGQNIRRFILPQNDEAHDSNPISYLRSRQPKIAGLGREMTGQSLDGNEFPMELTVSGLMLTSHRVLKCFIRDLSARKQLEAESRRHLMELAHLTRVSTVGELSGSLAHELNQPLTAILSNAQAARRFLANGQPPDLDEVRDILKDIIEQNQRAGEIIRHMRAMLKKGKAQLQPSDLNEIIREALHILRSDLMARNVVVNLELDPRLPAVLCDRIQIQQVLMNLVLNSCDAMAKQDANERRLTIGTEREENNRARVTLADTGPGIPAELDGKIFEPFFSTKENGLGMGLAICSSIVISHGGRLWAARNGAPGAVFHFTIPLHTEAKA